MFIFGKNKYVKIGKNETPEKIIELLRRKGDDSLGYDQARDVERGLAEAFRGGHPENLQRVIAAEGLEKNAVGAMARVFESSTSHEEDMLLALAEVPEEHWHEKVTNMMLAGGHTMDEDVKTVICGCMKAHMAIDRARGAQLLAQAVFQGCDADTIGKIHRQGVRFDDAIRELSFAPASVPYAELLQKRLEAAPSANEALAASKDALERSVKAEKMLRASTVDLLEKAGIHVPPPTPLPPPESRKPAPRPKRDPDLFKDF